MFKKDTFRLIRKTLNRFASLVSIVFIGVAFMMGLLSTSTIMRNSVDTYDDRQKLQDLQLYSSYGFNDDDVEVIAGCEGIKNVYPSRFIDCYSMDEANNEMVVRARELCSDVNGFTVVDGRFPATDDEILILAEQTGLEGYQIGKTITLFLKDGDLSENLQQIEFTIVGTVKSSEYMNRFMPTSTLDNLSLQLVLYIPNNNFISKYYTSIYCTVEGADAYTGFTEEYRQFIVDTEDELQLRAATQQNKLKKEILKEYDDKIADGQQELADAKADGQKQLDDAKEQLNQANIKLIVSRMELETITTTIDTSKEQLDVEQDLLTEREDDINQRIEKTEQEDDQGRTFEEISADTLALYNAYNTLNALKDTDFESNAQQQIDTLNEENERQQAIIDENKENQSQTQAELNEVNMKLLSDPSNAELQQQRADLESELLVYTSTIASSQAIIDGNKITITNLKSVNNATYTSTITSAMAQIDEQAGGSISDKYDTISVLAAEKAQVETEKLALERSYDTLDASMESINEMQQQIEDGQKQYDDGLKQYQQGVIDFNNEIEKAEIELRKAQQDLDELPKAQWMILNRDSHHTSYMYENTCKQMNSIGIVMPFLFFLVAALVCMTTMTRLIDEQRGQIGIYRALGFSRRQIIGKYATYALLASIIGAIPALFAGMALFPTVIYTTWRLMYDLPEMVLSIPLGNALICVGSFSVLMVLVSCSVVNKSIKECPASLMRPKAPKKASKVFLEYIPVLWQRLSFTSKITARNLIRYKSRFLMTTIGVAGCTSLLVLGFGVKDSISDVVNVQYGRFCHYNYNVTLENDDHIDELLDLIDDDLNNEVIVPYQTYNASLTTAAGDEETIIVQVVDARDFTEMYHLENIEDSQQLKLNNNEVIITERFSQLNNVNVGDTITLSSSGSLKAEVKVGAISKMYFQHYCYISEALYESLFDENVHYNNIAILNETDALAMIETVSQFEDVVSVSDFSAFIGQFDIMIQALDLIILVIIVTSGCLAFVVLINLSQVNISERLREIATLKVLGFHPKEVDGYIGKEILLLTIIGSLVGLPLGKIELKFVMSVINMEMVMFPTDIKVSSYLYGIAITMVFTIIVLFSMRKPLRKIQMVESLKSVE